MWKLIIWIIDVISIIAFVKFVDVNSASDKTAALYALLIGIMGILFFMIPILSFDSFLCNLRIKRHKYYLRAKFPEIDIDEMTKKERNKVIAEVDNLACRKYMPSGSQLGYRRSLISILFMILIASLKTTDFYENREKCKEENLEYLKSRHPEIDFDEPTKQDKIVINDELDIIMFLNSKYQE